MTDETTIRRLVDELEAQAAEFECVCDRVCDRAVIASAEADLNAARERLFAALGFKTKSEPAAPAMKDGA